MYDKFIARKLREKEESEKSAKRNRRGGVRSSYIHGPPRAVEKQAETDSRDSFWNSIDIRYWRGKVKCKILERHDKKVIVEYLENGLIGTIDLGKKFVLVGDKDITLIRHCWRMRKEYKK